MSRWLRFEHEGRIGFGSLDEDEITVHDGDLFDTPRPSGERLRLDQIRLLTPCDPSKMIALWNNFHALAEKLGIETPAEPLYFIKASNAFLAGNQTIRRPASYDGRVVYEGELGIVVGKRCAQATVEEAEAAIFGYTCVNDVTAVDLLNKDPSFAQWTRAKSFDGFGVFGPVVATGLDPGRLSIRTVLNGAERQNYPVSDMVFQPVELVRLLSQDITLMPGDLIACGTSIGVGSMKEPENQVEVSIEGIGTLASTFVQGTQ